MEILDTPGSKRKSKWAKFIQICRIYLKDLVNLFAGSGGGKGRNGVIS